MARRQKLIEKELPLELPKPAAKPTGKVLDPQSDATLPLSNGLSIRRCVGNYTSVDRKFWAMLIALAWDNLDKKSIHEANLRDIARVFRELKSGDNGIDWLIASARRLERSSLEWEDDEEIGSTVLLAGLKIIKATGKIYYQFSDFLIEEILDNKFFSRLRLHFMIGLNSKYSVSMYTLLARAVNMRRPVIDMTVDELRNALSVPKGKLLPWKNFKAFAIEPAIAEINDNSLAAGFSVEFEQITTGRKVERVRFTVKKHPMLEADDERIKVRVATAKAKAVADGGKRLPLAAIEKARKAIDSAGLVMPDMNLAEADFLAWAESRPVPIKNIETAFVVFCKKRASTLH